MAAPSAPPAAPERGTPPISSLPTTPANLTSQRGPLANATVSQRVSVAVGDCIRILGDSDRHRHLSLANLEPLVMPAVTTGQFAIGEAREEATGFTRPVGLVIWASVSSDVDRRLAEGAGAMRLQSAE